MGRSRSGEGMALFLIFSNDLEVVAEGREGHRRTKAVFILMWKVQFQPFIHYIYSQQIKSDIILSRIFLTIFSDNVFNFSST